MREITHAAMEWFGPFSRDRDPFDINVSAVRPCLGDGGREEARGPDCAGSIRTSLVEWCGTFRRMPELGLGLAEWRPCARVSRWDITQGGMSLALGWRLPVTSTLLCAIVDVVERSLSRLLLGRHSLNEWIRLSRVFVTAGPSQISEGKSLVG